MNTVAFVFAVLATVGCVVLAFALKPSLFRTEQSLMDEAVAKGYYAEGKLVKCKYVPQGDISDKNDYPYYKTVYEFEYGGKTYTKHYKQVRGNYPRETETFYFPRGNPKKAWTQWDDKPKTVAAALYPFVAMILLGIFYRIFSGNMGG